MSKTVIIRGTAVVNFIKVINGMDDDEAATLEGDVDLQEFQIDFEDCTDLVSIESIELQVRP